MTKDNCEMCLFGVQVYIGNTLSGARPNPRVQPPSPFQRRLSSLQ